MLRLVGVTRTRNRQPSEVLSTIDSLPQTFGVFFCVIRLNV